MLQKVPLSPMGWLALGAALASAGLAAAAFLLPRMPVADCVTAETRILPSGRTAQLCEIIAEPQPHNSELWLVVRMVVPELPAPGSDDARTDHDWACAQVGLREAISGASAPAALPARIVVQMMAQPFPRGEPSPGINQSIEAYSIQNGSCIWELL